MLLLLATLASAAPTCPATSAELDATAADVETAFAQMDAAALGSSVSDLLAEVACLRETLPPAVAARVHRARALSAFVDGNDAETRRALYAAQVLDPAGDLPKSAVPADHPIRDLLPQLAGTPAVATVPAPSSGYTVYFDGSATLSRPSDRPTVFQLGNARGVVVQGQYLTTDEVMPPYARGGTSTAPTVRQPASGGHASVPWAIAGGTALALGGVTYAMAGMSHARFENPDTRVGDLPRLRTRTNTLVLTSAGLAGIGLAGGLGAVIVGEW